LLHEILQSSAVAQRQNNVEEQGLSWRKLTDELRLPIDNRVAHMPRQELLRLGLSWDGEQQEQGRADKRDPCQQGGRAFSHFLVLFFCPLGFSDVERWAV
jgi:hypothetical protein